MVVVVLVAEGAPVAEVEVAEVAEVTPMAEVEVVPLALAVPGRVIEDRQENLLCTQSLRLSLLLVRLHFPRASLASQCLRERP